MLKISKILSGSTKKSMTDSLTTLLTGLLQKKGVLSDDYQTLVSAIGDALYEVDQMVQDGEAVTFPNGNRYVKHDFRKQGSIWHLYGDEDESPRDWDDDDDFADPGGNSSLRAGDRVYPCPTCGKENSLTAGDVRRGYQCDRCADRDEGRGYGREEY